MDYSQKASDFATRSKFIDVLLIYERDRPKVRYLKDFYPFWSKKHIKNRQMDQ